MLKRLIGIMMLAVGFISNSQALAANETNRLVLQQETTIDTCATEVVIPVQLENENAIVGFQCDLSLPTGFSVAYKEDGDYQVELGRTTTSQHNLNIRQLDNGCLRVLCSSTKNTAFTENSGTVLNLTLSVNANVEVGTYSVSMKNIVLTDSLATRYTADDVTGNIIVKLPDPITITANNLTMVYGDDVPELTFTTEGVELEGSPQLTCEATKTSPTGTYAIVVSKGTVANKRAFYVNGTLTITKAPLTIKAGDYTRMEGEDNPTFTATYEGFKNNETDEVLTTKPSISCEATKESTVGEYTVTVSGAEATNYEISYVNGKLTVTEAPVTVTAKSYTRAYGDANPTFEFTSEGAALKGTPSITCEATATSPVGTYAITITKGDVENQNITFVNGTLTITKTPLSIAAGTYTKKQGDAMPEFTLTYTGFKNNETDTVLTKKPTISCEANEASAPGEYTVSVSGAEAANYDISYTNGKLIVTDADAVIVKANNYTRVYGDANPTFEYSVEGTELDGTPEISCEATATSPVGTYDIIVKQGTVKNYNVSYVAGTLTITKAPLTIKAGDYTRMEGEDNPTFAVTYEGLKNNETDTVLTKKPTISCEATKESPAGEYTVTVSGAEATNYEISYVNGKLTVTEAPVTVTAKSYTRAYGDANPTFEFTSEGAALKGTPSISCEATATSPVGTYAITIAKGEVENQNITFVNGTLTITKAPLSIAAGTYTKKQGDAMPEFTLTYTGFKNNETDSVLTKKPTVSCEATETSAPGEYSVSVSGAEAANYDISYTNGKLIVTDADAVIVKANNYTRVYGDANPTFEYSVEGTKLDGTPEISCEATATSPVGTYDIIVKQGTVKNYNVSYVAGTLTITKAPLTIKAGDCTRMEGEDNPAFAITYEGFKNNETDTVLTKKPTVSCEATKESPAGEYVVTVSGAEATNYEISYVNGKLTVTEAPVTVTAKSYTKAYGDENPTFEFTSEGAALKGKPSITCEATTLSPVGTYVITIAKGDVENQNITFVNGTLTITKAPLSIAAGTYTKKQGDAMPKFTLTYTGFKNNETDTVLTKKPTVSCEATEASAPGEYPIVVSGAEAQNYEISYTNGKLIVTEADLVTITAKSYSREYGEANPTFEFTSEGTTLDGKPGIACEATATSPVGTYDIVVKQGTVKNYNVSYVAGTLTITKAPLTATAQNCTREQGQDNPMFAVTYEGWKNNEDESVLITKPIATTTATIDSPVGEYPITVSGGEAQNYELKYVDGVLSVTVPANIYDILLSGKPFDVYSLNGQIVRSQVTSLKGLPKGVYLIEGHKVTIK